MWLSEQVLFYLAKLLYKSELAHTNEMKRALSDPTEVGYQRIAETFFSSVQVNLENR